MVASGARPLREPAISEATAVPCPTGSVRPSVEPSTKSAPASTRPDSSSWEASTPESTTATVMPEPVECDQARSGSSHSSGPIGAASSSAVGWATPAVPAILSARVEPAVPAVPAGAAVPVAPTDAAAPAVASLAPVAATGTSSTAATATAATARDRAGTGTTRFSQNLTPTAAAFPLPGRPAGPGTALPVTGGVRSGVGRQCDLDQPPVVTPGHQPAPTGREWLRCGRAAQRTFARVARPAQARGLQFRRSRQPRPP